MKNYSEKYNCFFIHIPKNAGTSINNALEIPKENRGHRTVDELKELLNIDKLNAPSFCVIRNPWDRMVSLYRFRKKKGHDKIIFGDSNYSFKEWLLNPNTPLTSGKMEWVNQVDIIHPKNKLLVDYVLRYENLNEEWFEFCKLLGIPLLTLPHSNTSGGKKNYREYYDSETRDFVYKRFIKDLKMLGYEF